MLRNSLLAFGLLLGFAGHALAQDEPPQKTGFSQEEILRQAESFFGDITEGLAKLIEKSFAEQGRPNALIVGEEVSGAIGIGARYGQGELRLHKGEQRPIFWQGPSIGFDTGGNASKVMTLIYNLENPDEQLYQRIPGVDGSLYFIAGASLNYLKAGDMILAPIRSGVGARAGVSVGYLHFTHKKSWNPF